MSRFLISVSTDSKAQHPIQEAGPLWISRPQSTLSGASVVAAAASDEKDEGGVSISVQFHGYVAVCFADMYSNIDVLHMSAEIIS